jgi:hypothetical protein
MPSALGYGEFEYYFSGCGKEVIVGLSALRLGLVSELVLHRLGHRRSDVGDGADRAGTL